jgi:hypothetical protein
MMGLMTVKDSKMQKRVQHTNKQRGYAVRLGLEHSETGSLLGAWFHLFCFLLLGNAAITARLLLRNINTEKTEPMYKTRE